MSTMQTQKNECMTTHLNIIKTHDKNNMLHKLHAFMRALEHP